MMHEEMTVMTKPDKVFRRVILPIPVKVMNRQDPVILSLA